MKKRNRLALLPAVLLTVLLAAAGCTETYMEETDTAARNENIDVMETDETAAETEIPDTASPVIETEPETASPEQSAAEGLVTVLANESSFNIRPLALPLETIGTDYLQFTFSERYMIFVTYDSERDENNIRTYKNIRLYIADLDSGTMVYDCPLGTRPANISCTADGCVLYATGYDAERAASYLTCSYSVILSDGIFTVEETEIPLYPRYESRVTSPDGNYSAFAAVDDETSDGGMDLLCPDGSIRRIKENRMLDGKADNMEAAIADVTGYTPVGFIDNTHLLYKIVAWEGIKGYGIYDVTTGEATEIPDRHYYPIGVYDGRYFLKYRANSIDTYFSTFDAILAVTPDGEETVLASINSEDTPTLEVTEFDSIGFMHSVWVHFVNAVPGMGYREMGESVKVHAKLYSHDFSALLAELEYPTDALLYIYHDTAAVIVPVYAG